MTRVATAAIALVCALAVVTPTASAELSALQAPGAEGKKVTGRWVGTVRNDVGRDYRAFVRIHRTDSGLRGRVRYSRPVCRGQWRFLGRGGGWVRFREVITYDPGAKTCVKRLRVKVRRVDARLRVVWSYGQRHTSMRAHRQG